MSSLRVPTDRVPTYDSARIKLQSIFELRELLRYRFLVWNLVSRDLKVRYKRSFLGFIWVMLNPLLMTAVLAVVFSSFIRFKGVEYYPAFLLAGILLFNLFSQGSVAAMSSLSGNGATLKRMYIPPSVFVTSAVGSALVNLVFALAPLFGVSLILGARPSITWLYTVVPCLEVTILTLGVGLIVSALMVFFTDIFEIYTVLLNVFIYLTPTFYPVTILPEPLRSWEQFNPMFLAMDGLRMAVLQGQLPSLREALAPGAMALVVFIVGWLFFTRLEAKFAYHF
jgi:ABC-type polysaccharide/polyol phosphate export permease